MYTIQNRSASKFTEVMSPEKEALNVYPFSPEDYSNISPQTPAYEEVYQTRSLSTSRPSTLLGSFQSFDASDVERLPKYSEIPERKLALTSEYITAPVIHVDGGARHPDLSVTLPDGKQLYHLSTESTWVYHETHVKDLRTPQSLFNIRRHPIKGKPDEHWRYTIHSHVAGTKIEGSSSGVKILEIDTTPGILRGGRNQSWSTRLIFRDHQTGELDGLTLTTTQEGLTSKGTGGEVFYQGIRVATITDKKKNDPGYEIRLERQNLDPLLIVMMAYVIDDRRMESRRRNRRSRAAGLKGVGKGPGAGLAGAYGLALLI